MREDHKCGSTTEEDPWIRAIKAKKTLNVSKAVEYLEQAVQFSAICRTHRRALGAPLRLKTNTENSELSTARYSLYIEIGLICGA